MDEIEEMFRTLEEEVSHVFSAERTKELWGLDTTAINPGQTIKGAERVSMTGNSSTVAGAFSAAPDDVSIAYGYMSTERGSGARPVPTQATGTVKQATGGTNRAGWDSTVSLTIGNDGTAYMTMPGASVTLTPRRISEDGGGEYEMGEVLGKGGMGVVNVARQASLDRRIVVKTIRPEFAGRVEAQEKFITEALATGSLDHPNVVPIHDMGVGADGNLFYVMKEVRGKNWRELMPTLSEGENIDILMRVCDAMACAHDRGIIHRDLKPENIMLGDYGEVLVMDWGLAAAVSPTAKASHLTDSTACAGTPSFMAPEMARGLAHDLGPWSDQYLLGAILFNILTGRPPHPGRNAQECVTNAANNVIVDSERNDEWINVAKRAMHTLPHRRFPSVKAFQKALRNCRVHAESIILANKGDEELAKAMRSEGHAEFTRAINMYEQALVLWSENANAAEKLDEARFAYAEKAFDKGDYGLVVSLLEKSREKRDREMVADAEKEMALRDARRRRVKILGFVAVLLLLLVAVVAGVAYFLISQQAAAERRAREEAEQQRHLAELRRSEADEQRTIAETQRNEADEQRIIADEQRRKAEDALRAAETARTAEAKAKDQQLREQQAKLAAEERARQRAEEALRAREQIQRMGYLEDNSRWRFDEREAVQRQRGDSERFRLPVDRTVQLPGATLAMKLIPSGFYVMGSPPRDPTRNNDEYLHEVELSRPLYLSTTEVTRRQWQAVVGVENMDALGRGVADDKKLEIVAWRTRPVPEDEGDLPATGVSFTDIRTLFLPALAKAVPDGSRYRLPTEAEWEWASRAGTTGHFYTGDSPAELDKAGWYEVNSYGRAQRVGLKEPNAWGLHDVIGNVWEINLDTYDSLYFLRSPGVDPANLDPSSPFRISRGGSYLSSPRLCRVSNRATYIHIDNRYPHVGFRLAYSDWQPSDETGAQGE